MLRIHIGINADPDLAFYLNEDPDSRRKTNADPDSDPGHTSPSQDVKILHVKPF
jgi:hypothetical protein